MQRYASARFTLSLTVLLTMTMLMACTSVSIQAPYDSFVCFNTSFNGCLKQAQSNQLQVFHSQAYPNLAKTSYKVVDADSGKIIATSDGRYQCVFGRIPYTQSLNVDEVASAVFVSPVLLSQIGEQQVRLTKTRESCQRTIQAYSYQLDILIAQDALAKSQKALSQLSSEIETDRNALQKVGLRQLTANQAKELGVTSGTTVSAAIATIRESVTTQSELLREKYKVQTVDQEYRKLFENANLAIDAQLRELARQLFVLDRSIVVGEVSVWRPEDYRDGTWIQKGTVVLRLRK